MNKEFKTVMLRDLDERTNEILNQVGAKIGKKSATDIIQHIIYQYPTNINQINDLSKRVQYQSTKLSDYAMQITDLQNRLDRIKNIC